MNYTSLVPFALKVSRLVRQTGLIDSPLCQGPRLYRPLPSRFTYLPFLGTCRYIGGTALLTPAPYQHDTYTCMYHCSGFVFPLYLPYVLHLEGAKSLHHFHRFHKVYTHISSADRGAVETYRRLRNMPPSSHHHIIIHVLQATTTTTTRDIYSIFIYVRLQVYIN